MSIAHILSPFLNEIFIIQLPNDTPVQLAQISENNIDQFNDKEDEVWKLSSHTRELEAIKHAKKKFKFEILTSTKSLFSF